MSPASPESEMSEDEVEHLVTPGSPITPDDSKRLKTSTSMARTQLTIHTNAKSASPNPHIREDHITHSYQQKNTHTVTAEITSRGPERLMEVYAQTQTSITTPSSEGHAGAHIALEVTHEEVDLEDFCEALFGDRMLTDFSEPAKTLAGNDVFTTTIRHYAACFGSEEHVAEESVADQAAEADEADDALDADDSDDSDDSDEEPDSDAHLLDAFRQIAGHPRDPDHPPSLEMQVFPRAEYGDGEHLDAMKWVASDLSGDRMEETDDVEALDVEKMEHGSARKDFPEFAAVFRSKSARPCSWNDFAFLVEPVAATFEAQLAASVAAGLDATSTTPSASSPPSSRPPPPKPPGELLRCVQELFSYQGTRRHVLGVSLDQKSTRLWYFDRAGSIRTKPRNLDDDLMLRALLRLHNADAHELGREPCLQLNSSLSPSGRLVRPFEGKGSVVEVQGTRLLITRTLHTAYELFGRGTAVFAAETLLDESHHGSIALPAKVVVKMAWQPKDSGDESELFRLAAEKGVKGLTKLYRATTFSQLSSGARGALPLRHEARYQDRELRVQVMGPVCIPLYRVTDLDKFKKAFISLVKAHHNLYNAAGILHHDISVNNLMVDETDHSVGVLIDLDLAVRIRDGEEKLAFGPVHAGTLPFRSVHVLEQGEWVRELYYRDDLESFFFTLVWILTYFDLPFSERVGDWSPWCRSILEANANFKVGFMGDTMSDLPRGPLKDLWLVRLGRLIFRGYNYMSDHSDADSSTLGGILTFESFKAILESNP